MVATEPSEEDGSGRKAGLETGEDVVGQVVEGVEGDGLSEVVSKEAVVVVTELDSAMVNIAGEEDDDISNDVLSHMLVSDSDPGLTLQL